MLPDQAGISKTLRIMIKQTTIFPLVVALLSVTASNALADVDFVSAKSMGKYGLQAIAWGIAVAGLFIGLGLAIGRRK